MSFSRACAIAFASVGIYWAIVVALAQLIAVCTSPKAAFIALTYYLPGWLTYFGWADLAAGRGVGPVPPRLFWIFSATVNLGYFAHEYEPWRYIGDYHRPLNIAAYWWLATGFLSLVCAAFPGPRTAKRGSGKPATTAPLAD